MGYAASTTGVTLGRLSRTLVLALALTSPLALIACAGPGPGGGTSPSTRPTLVPVARPPTPTPAAPTPAALASPTDGTGLPAGGASPRTDLGSLCDLLTPDEADEALGEFVTGILDLSQGLNSYCEYETDSDSFLRIQLGAPSDFEAGAQLAGVAAVPVPGVGEAAVWFGGEMGVLSVRERNSYFRLVLNLPGTDAAAQLAIATGLAARVIERLP